MSKSSEYLAELYNLKLVKIRHIIKEDLYILTIEKTPERTFWEWLRGKQPSPYRFDVIGIKSCWRYTPSGVYCNIYLDNNINALLRQYEDGKILAENPE